MDKDTTAFKLRFNDYKNGKPISEIYDAGLPRYAGGKRGYIGGSTKHARETVWNTDRTLSNAVDSIANTYLLKDGLLLHRLNEEGFTDKAIRLYNNAINQSLYTGENLLNNKTDFSGVGDFGLDDAGTMILNNQMLLKGEKWWDEEGENEQGRITHGAVGDTVRDTIGLQASALKYFSDQVKKDYPNLSDYDNARYTQAYYLRGVGGGRKWAKAGAKGYNFSTKPLAMRPAENPYLIQTTIQNTAAPKFGKYANGKLPRYKDGTRYLWDDQKGEWDRITDSDVANAMALWVFTPTTTRAKFDYENTPNPVKPLSKNEAVVPDNTFLTRQSIEKANNTRTWLSDAADVAHGMGEGAMMAANFIPFEGELMAGAKWLGRLAKSYLKHPDYITAYHGSPYPFDIRNAWTATPYDLGLHVGRNSIAERMAERNGVVYKLRIPPQDTETIDIGANGYKLLSNDIFKPAHPYGKGSNFGYYDSAGDNALEIRMLEQAGAKPTVVGDRLYTEKDAVLPLRTTVYPDIPESELRAIDEIFRDARMKTVTEDLLGRLFLTLPENVRLDLNRRANDILSRSGYKVIKYNNTNPYEGGGGTSYMITDPSVIDVIPDKPILKPLLYPSFINSVYQLNENGYPGFKNGKSPIHINPANRGKFNATKKRTGKTTEELAHSSNPLTRKRAIFALNARKWKH